MPPSSAPHSTGRAPPTGYKIVREHLKREPTPGTRWSPRLVQAKKGSEIDAMSPRMADEYASKAELAAKRARRVAEDKRAANRAASGIAFAAPPAAAGSSAAGCSSQPEAKASDKQPESSHSLRPRRELKPELATPVLKARGKDKIRVDSP